MEWIRELATALVPLLAAFCGWAAARLRAGTKKDKAMEYGMKMLLRERIIDRGMHSAYVDLGDGDRSVNIIVERCKNLNIVNGG